MMPLPLTHCPFMKDDAHTIPHSRHHAHMTNAHECRQFRRTKRRMDEMHWRVIPSAKRRIDTRNTLVQPHELRAISRGIPFLLLQHSRLHKHDLTDKVGILLEQFLKSKLLMKQALKEIIMKVDTHDNLEAFKAGALIHNAVFDKLRTDMSL